MNIDDRHERAEVVKHLHPMCLKELVSHISKMLAGHSSHAVPSEDRARVQAALKPNLRHLKKLIRAAEKESGGLDLRKQRGGFITALLAAVVPLVGQLIWSAVSKKRK